MWRFLLIKIMLNCSAQPDNSPGIAEVGRCWDVARKIPWGISGDYDI